MSYRLTTTNCDVCGNAGVSKPNQPEAKGYNMYCKPCDNWFASANQINQWERQRRKAEKAAQPEDIPWGLPDFFQSHYKSFLQDSLTESLESI